MRAFLPCLVALTALVSAGCSESANPDREIDAGTDAGPADAGTDAPPEDAGVDASYDGGPLRTPAVRYRVDEVQSRLSPLALAAMRGIVARSGDTDDHVFMKVGDDAMARSEFLRCLARDSAALDLGPHTLLDVSLEHFRSGTVPPGSTSPFERDSEAVLANATLTDVLTGSPKPVIEEATQTEARFALVMLGTHELDPSANPAALGPRFLRRYTEKLSDLVDALTARGIVPVLVALPERRDDAAKRRWVRTLNAIVRGIAERNGAPFIDLHLALSNLASAGIAADGLTLTSDPSGACRFTEAGLAFGVNTMNLAALEALDRLHRGVTRSTLPPEASDAEFVGRGDLLEPRVIDRFPFTDSRRFGDAGSGRRLDYGGCGGESNESAPEFVYRLTLDAPTRLRVMALPRNGFEECETTSPADEPLCRNAEDLRLHRLDAAGNCVESDRTMLEGNLAAGTHLFVVDGFAAPPSTPVLFSVVECDADDPRCD